MLNPAFFDELSGYQYGGFFFSSLNSIGEWRTFRFGVRYMFN